MPVIVDDDEVTLDDDGVTLDDDAVLEDSACAGEDVELEPGCTCCPVFVEGIKKFPKPLGILNFCSQQLWFAALEPGLSLQQNEPVKTPFTFGQGIMLLKMCVAAFPAINMLVKSTQDSEPTSLIRTIDTVLRAIRRLP